jgi:hypothetical protein
MRATLTVLLQLALALLVAGAVVPMLMFSVTRARQPRVGPWIVFGLVGAVFLVLRLIWPKRRSSRP